MGLFGNKKLSLEEILKGIDNLSEEEKAQVLAKVQKTETAETEAETPEETQVESEQTKEQGEESTEQTEEVEESVEAEETAETDGEPVEQVEETPEQTEEPANEVDPTEEKNREDVMAGLVQRVSELEQKFSALEALKEKMDEYTKKQAEKFGYSGSTPGAKKDYSEMSADEMGKQLRTEI